MEIGGMTVPWWVYVIIALVVIIILYAFYKKLTAYTPQATAFNTTETPLPANFDAAGKAANADSILSETFGSDSQTLVAELAALDDNELIAVSNAFNDQYFSKDNGSLLTNLQKLDFPFSSSKPRDQLVTRMQNIGLT